MPGIDDDGDDAFLTDIFAEARQAPSLPSPDFMARILADANAMQPDQSRPARVSRGQGFLAIFGGWRGIGGMTTAALAGLWIGFAGSDQIGSVADGLWTGTSVETVELWPSNDVFALALEGDG